MKLETRRTIRRWLLDLPDRTLLATGAGFLGLLVLGGVSSTDLVFGVGLAGLLGVVYIAGNVDFDACPNCRMEVCATDDRYCATCGARLDELEAAPPIDERVDERHRPVGLEEIERSPELEAIADGGEFGDEEVDR
ncbi:zinc ribbon domain-containing protein [Halorubrum sp. CBA1229]|uniref:zinc ribbon domain-containing protein n=1 Tax=Halorubrum sp. CBA1229 TaxID=1853699 RepID=UPI0020D16BF9|nr:zinc ribbon domain-containing protein [Halorubrum sp. CBA1229]